MFSFICHKYNLQSKNIRHFSTSYIIRKQKRTKRKQYIYVSSTNSIFLRYADISKDQYLFIIKDPIEAACFVSY